ncbi:MAG: PAS domain S-box protein [Pirellulales bacterium]|nr:PAS domain S-box protein [Pirellulales bacterium]
MRERPTIFQATSMAVIAVVTALLCRVAVAPWLGDRLPFMTFLPVAFVLAYRGGIQPTSIFAILSIPPLVFYLLPPSNSFAIELSEHRFGLAIYVVIVLATGWLGEQMHTAQWRLEQAREQAVADRERLRVTLASIGDAVIVTDALGRVVSLNAVAEELTGWQAVSGLHRRLEEIFRIVNEETRAPVENPCAIVVATGKAVVPANHTLLISRDGTERPIDDSAAPIKDADGKLLGVVIVFRDVSRQRAAIKALVRSERDLADFFENAAVGLHWVDPEGTIVRANRADYELLGHTEETYVGRKIWEFHADRSDINEMLKRLKSGETLTNYEAALRHRDGSLRHVLITSNVLWDNGRFVHSRCFTRDNTARKRAEEGLSFLVEATTTLAAIVDRDSALRRAARITVPYLADYSVLTMIGRERQIEFEAYAHRDPAREERLTSLLSRFPLNWNSPSLVVAALDTGQSQFVPELGPAQLSSLVWSDEQMVVVAALQPRSAIVVPLVIRERVIGALSLVMAESLRTYTTQDLKLAEEFARRVATALDNAQLVASLQANNR